MTWTATLQAHDLAWVPTPSLKERIVIQHNMPARYFTGGKVIVLFDMQELEALTHLKWTHYPFVEHTPVEAVAYNSFYYFRATNSERLCKVATTTKDTPTDDLQTFLAIDDYFLHDSVPS